MACVRGFGESLVWFFGSEISTSRIEGEDMKLYGWLRNCAAEQLDTPTILDLSGSKCTDMAVEKAIDLLACLLGRNLSLGICLSDSADPLRLVAQAGVRFGLVLPILLEGSSWIVEADASQANMLLLRESRPEYPNLSKDELRAYCELLTGCPDQGHQLLRNAGVFRGEGYSSVRFWNKLLHNRRESLASGLENGMKHERVVGVWDLRFAPHALGEFLYFLAVLRCIADEANAKHVEIWSLVPDSKFIRFDQGELDEPIRSSRVQQFEELSKFFPNGIAAYKTYSQPDEFDKELTDAMADSVIVPRFNSKAGGMFASYLHNYRFLSSAFNRTGWLPYLGLSDSCRKVAEDRIKKIRVESGKCYIIVTHLRYSKLDPIRNVEIDEWIDFFKQAEGKYNNFLFLLLGENELKKRIESNGAGKNLRFAGEDLLGVFADFSLIYVADGFLGGPSGPAIVPLLSRVPYLFYKYKLVNELPYLDPPSSFPWACRFQRIHWLEHDSRGLVEAFDDWVSELEEGKLYE